MPERSIPLDPQRDLAFSRTVDLSAAQIWKAWTQPDHLMPWFCPRPWLTTACEIDLHPGGRFFTLMRSPEGQEFPNEGCYLEVVENRRLVWTNALLPGFRPAPNGAELGFFFSAAITLEPAGSGTLYSARVTHGNAEDCNKHAAMGFNEGWGIALDQLVAYMKAA